MTGRVQPTNYSGSITNGGSAQALLSANQKRSYLFITNPGTETFTVNPMGTAVQGEGIPVYPGGSITMTLNDAVLTFAFSIVGPTTGQKFTCYEEAYQ